VSPAARVGYAGVTAGIVAAGVAMTALLGGPARGAAVGASLAWALQAPATWWLAAALSRGRGVTGRWAAGLALRVAGVAVLGVLAPSLDVSRGPAIVAYGGAMVVFLLAEAAWLWWASDETA